MRAKTGVKLGLGRGLEAYKTYRLRNGMAVLNRGTNWSDKKIKFCELNFRVLKGSTFSHIDFDEI